MRELKIVPIFHTEEEIRVSFPEGHQSLMKEQWKKIGSLINECYEDWTEVQIYSDAFAIPGEYKDPEMTDESYKDLWINRLKSTGSPLGHTIESLLDRGAVLESTEISEKKFWTRYQRELSRVLYRSDALVLDRLDERRDKFIASRISESLEKKGLLLIGARHISSLMDQEWSEDIDIQVK